MSSDTDFKITLKPAYAVSGAVRGHRIQPGALSMANTGGKKAREGREKGERRQGDARPALRLGWGGVVARDVFH